MTFKTLLSDINNVALAMESLKNITQFNTGSTIANGEALSNVAIEQYKTSIDGLNLSQAQAALSATALNDAQKQQILTSAGLLESTQAVTLEEVKQMASSATLSAQKKEEILATLQGAYSEGQWNTERLEAIASGEGEAATIAQTILAKKTESAENVKNIAGRKALTASLKEELAARIALMASNPVTWIVGIAAVSAGLIALQKKFSKSLEECTEDLKKYNSEFENAQSEAESLNKEWKTCHDRLDELKKLAENGTISIIEQEEYERLQKTNDELERNLKIEREKAQLNAIDGAKTADETVNKTVQSNYVRGDVDSYEGIVLHDQLLNVTPKEELEGAIAEYNRLQGEIDKLNKSYDTGSISSEDYTTQINSLTDAQTKTRTRASEMSDILIECEQSYNNLENTGGKFTTTSQQNYDSVKLANQEYSNFLDTINGVNASFDKLDTGEKAQTLKNKYAQKILQLENGQGSYTIEDKEISDWIDGLSDDDLSVLATINFSGEQTKESMQEALDYAKTHTDATSQETSISKSISATVSQLNTQLKPVFSSLQSAYQSIFTTDGFTLKDIDISDFESIRSDLEELGKKLSIDIDYSTFDNFVSVLSNAESTSEDVQNAFNDLATTITNLGVNGAEEFETLKKALSDFGIVNNDIIAFNALISNTEALKEAGLDLADATSEEIQAFTEERVSAENVQEAISLFLQQKISCIDTVINSQEDINDLIALAKAAGIASAAIAQLGGLKLAYDKEVADGNSQAALAIASQMENVKAQVQAEITGLYDSKLNYKGSGKGKSKSSSGSSSDSTKTFNWIQRAIEEIESRISNLDTVINSTFSSVTDKNNALIEQIGLINDEIELQQKAYEGYMQKADSVGLSDYYKNLVQNGAINIEDIKDKKLQERISNYQDYYDKAQDTLDKINQLHEQAMKKHIDCYENETDALKDKLDNQAITEKQYIDAMDSVWKRYFENQVEYAEVAKQKKLELLNEEKSYLQSVGSAAISLLDDQTDELDKQKEIATKVYQDQIDTLNNLKKPLEIELDLMQKARDATSKQLEYEKALYELRRAENQRTKLMYINGQMSYVTDSANIRDKKDAVDDAQYELLKFHIQSQIDDIDNQIDHLNDLIDQTEKYYDTQIDNINKYKEEWQKAIDMEELAINMQNFIDKFGEGSIGRLLNEDMSLITEWKQSYLDNMAEIDVTSNGTIGDITKKFSELAGVDISPSISSIDALNEVTDALSSTISDVNNKIGGSGGNSPATVQGASGSDNVNATNSSSGDSGSLTGAMTELSDTTLNEESGIPAQTAAWEDMEVPLNAIYELLNNIKVTLEDLDGKTFTVTLNANSNIPNIPSSSKSATFTSSGGGHAFASGTDGLSRAEKNALISEYNQPELVIYPNGAYKLFTSPTVTDLPKDTVVLNEEQTKKAIQGNSGITEGKAFDDGTVPGHPELRELQPGDATYDMLKKVEEYFSKNTDALIMNTNVLEKQRERIINDARNISNNVVNNQQQAVNLSIGDIHVHEVQNVDGLVHAIIHQVPGKMLQEMHRR